jgi:hypothetical protein
MCCPSELGSAADSASCGPLPVLIHPVPTHLTRQVFAGRPRRAAAGLGGDVRILTRFRGPLLLVRERSCIRCRADIATAATWAMRSYRGELRRKLRRMERSLESAPGLPWQPPSPGPTTCLSRLGAAAGLALDQPFAGERRTLPVGRLRRPGPERRQREAHADVHITRPEPRRSGASR